MSNDEIEIGEEVEITELVDENGDVVGAIVDDLVVATSEDGSIVDEIVDVFDADGNLVAEDEVVDVFDADGNLVAEAEQIIVAE